MASVIVSERRGVNATAVLTDDMRSGMNDAAYAAYTQTSTPDNTRKLDLVIRKIPLEQALSFLKQTSLPKDEEEGRTALTLLSKAVDDGHFSKDVTHVLETLIGWPTTAETALALAMAWRYIEERVHRQAEIPGTTMRAEWQCLKGTQCTFSRTVVVPVAVETFLRRLEATTQIESIWGENWFDRIPHALKLGEWLQVETLSIDTLEAVARSVKHEVDTLEAVASVKHEIMMPENVSAEWILGLKSMLLFRSGRPGSPIRIPLFPPDLLSHHGSGVNDSGWRFISDTRGTAPVFYEATEESE